MPLKNKKSYFLRDFKNKNFKGIELNYSDFRECTFRNIEITNSSLRNSIFNGCSFYDCDLSGSDFTSTHLESIEIKNSEVKSTNFEFSVFENVKFKKCILNEIDLQNSKNKYVDFIHCELNDTNFQEALLRFCSFKSSKIDKITLENSSIYKSDFSNLKSSSLILGSTALVNLDIKPITNSNVQHISKSYVDIETVIKSFTSTNLQSFLSDAGIPNLIISNLISTVENLDPLTIKNHMFSTFICYGEPDKEFAYKLKEALGDNGVNSFLFEVDAIPGQKLHRTMRSEVYKYDRMILICSKNSLERGGVLNEIENGLEREANEKGKSIIIPITLDDYVHNEWHPEHEDVEIAIKSRVIANFKGLKGKSLKGSDQFMRLLNAFKKD